MGTQTTPPTADLPRATSCFCQGYAPGHRIRARTGSMWFDLAIAFVAGLLYALMVMGPGSLNPRNVDWVTVDPAYHYIGWELFRQDPHIHWPLTYTDRLGYPRGRVGRPAGPESFVGGRAEAVLASAARTHAILWLRGGAGVCPAVLLCVPDFPADSWDELSGNRAVQRVFPACAAAELPAHADITR